MADAPIRFHWLRLRTTAHGTEDADRVKQALRACTGLGGEAFEAAVEETLLESHHGGQVALLEVTLSRAREVRAALSAMLDAGTRAQLLEELEPRVDDDDVLYWRMDKQEAHLGTLRLGGGDDAIQCRLRVEVHPVRREKALEALRSLLSSDRI